VIAGLDRKDVCEMIKVSPQILNQKREVIEMKIDFLINDLGFPVSSLVRFPSYLSYTMQRAKLRLTMYNWLKEQGKVNPMLSFSTIVGCTDNVFLSQYVDRHPRGPEIWEDLKKEICSA
jgi:late competence protein required for DNA uptake (superfamily II DNA/RNA helicase)